MRKNKQTNIQNKNKNKKQYPFNANENKKIFKFVEYFNSLNIIQYFKQYELGEEKVEENTTELNFQVDFFFPG